MLQVRIVVSLLFLASVSMAIYSGSINAETHLYLKTLGIYWLFATLYSHLGVIVKKGNTNMDYGISYSLSIALFVGPLGLFIYETLYRFTVYFIRLVTNTGDPDELLHTFYNIGSFVLNSSIAYYLYLNLYPSFNAIPFGFWILIILLMCVIALLGDTYLIILFSFMGDIKNIPDAIEFLKSRSLADLGKSAFSNGLLFILLVEQQWEMLVALFILNYLVSRSFVSKSQVIQSKIERDKFEQMAYTDFMTGVHNRAFMDKKMKELGTSGEFLGIIVGDIDKFKQYNDNYNHAIGDKVIQHFANELKSHLKSEDFLFRTGGEEFTIFLRKRTYEECSELVEKMRYSVMCSPVHTEFRSQHVSINYTASFGLYYYKASEYLPVEKAYVNADHLLLNSKEDGKNCVSVCNGITDLPLSVRYSETPG